MCETSRRREKKSCLWCVYTYTALRGFFKRFFLQRGEQRIIYATLESEWQFRLRVEWQVVNEKRQHETFVYCSSDGKEEENGLKKSSFRTLRFDVIAKVSFRVFLIRQFFFSQARVAGRSAKARSGAFCFSYRNCAHENRVKSFLYDNPTYFSQDLFNMVIKLLGNKKKADESILRDIKEMF